MSFTYFEDLTTNIDFVRFHTGDTDEDGYFMSDELITSLVTVEGSKEAAVIGGLKYIIRKLSQPDFKADWLQVNHAEARKGYETMLKAARQDFGLSDVVTGATHVYRKDSLQTEEPTYEIEDD